MDPFLEESLRAMQREGLHLADEVGSGAIENLLCIQVPTKRQEIGVDELVEFVREAQRLRMQQAIGTGGPAVFYVWHDEQAGQLRLSVARGTLQTLPFGCRLELVQDVEMIVSEYLASRYRDGISWDELRPTPVSAIEELDTLEKINDSMGVLRVWGACLA